jgi:plasmid stabilization system protein ParE
MARGDKDKYTDKQKRQAEHIADGYSERGVPKKAAKARAWATVNKATGGGNKSGSGRGKPDTNVSAKAGGRKGGRKTAAKPTSTKQSAKRASKRTAKQASKQASKQTSVRTRDEQRSAAARKGWETRRQRSGAAAKVRKAQPRKAASR